jgi:predicted DNA-binding transcriptional regulator YafY
MARDDVVINHSALLRQLNILSYLSQQWGAYAHTLAEKFGVGIATIKRDIADCRHYGAEIIADRDGGYRLMNWEHIRPTVRKWRKLEQQRAANLERGL